MAVFPAIAKKTYFVSLGIHLWRREHDFWQFQQDPSYPPPGTLCCTSGVRAGDGVNRAEAQKNKSDRTPMLKVEHRNRRRPIGLSFQAARAAQRTSHCRTTCTVGGSKCCFLRVFACFPRGGGAHFLATFGDSWITKKTGV